MPLFVPSFQLDYYITKFYKDCFKILSIMLALCLMISMTYYAQNYAGTIGLGLYNYCNVHNVIVKLACYSCSLI